MLELTKSLIRIAKNQPFSQSYGDLDFYIALLEDEEEGRTHVMIQNTMFTTFEFLHLLLEEDEVSFYSDNSAMTEQEMQQIVKYVEEFCRVVGRTHSTRPLSVICQ